MALTVSAFWSTHHALATTATDRIFRVFHPVGVWEAVVDGQPETAPSVWSSDDGFHFLVAVPPDHHWVFVSPRRSRGLDLASVNIDVHVDPFSSEIQIGLPVESSDTFPLDIGKDSIAFANRGHRIELRRSQDAVGEVPCKALLERYPEMKREYDSYDPDPMIIAAIGRVAGGERVRVQAHLGTWCGHSMRDIPRLIRVVERVAPAVDLACVGISAPVSSDQRALSVGITEVPVIAGRNVANKELRAIGGELERPEEFILRVAAR